ncbi:MAG TPA: NAD(P)-binding domain-containing protein [Candidatus Bathyarchaeia archaeon]|nr:NAD(P)-binding domain-containing protein [Candidatus Bathyarchaeia archaeon]
MTANNQLPVTVIGLGSMGRALAAAYLKAGHPTTVWNRSEGKADDLVAAGANRAATLREAIAASPLVIICVLDYRTVMELLVPNEDSLEGKVLVNLTTGTPEEARETARWAESRGFDYLDGVIMAGPASIGGPEAMILYGGSRTTYDRHEATLKVLSANSPFLDKDTGVPTLYDLAMLALLWATSAGWLHAFALVGTAGIKAADFQPYAETWFRNVVAAERSDQLAADIDRGEYPDTFGSSLGLNAAGLALLARASREAGIDANMFSAIQALAEQRVADGRSADGFTSLIEAIKSPSQFKSSTV